MTSESRVKLGEGDALIVVDLQNDFLPGGALAVAQGDQVIAPLNAYARRFAEAGLPLFATRDWHPPDHCSFEAEGGIWPPHCVRDTPGAAFAPELELPEPTEIVSKAESSGEDAYSGFQKTGLADRLRELRVGRVFVGGLATDYCVLNTVRDALQEGFETFLLTDAIRGVEVEPGDSQRAIDEMRERGARPMTLADLA